MKNVFLIMVESHDGHRWVDTAYRDRAKAELICNAKNKEAANGNKYSVLHTPVND